MIKVKYKQLHEVAQYRNDRITTKQVTCATYISTENMIAEKGGITSATTIPESKSVCKYIANDILLSNIRPYFKKIWFSNKIGGCSNDVLVVKTKKGIYPKFLYYVLSDNNFFNYSTVTSKGTKMPRGSKHAIMKYLVPDVDLPTQKRIADILSAYDDLIENNNRRIKLLEKAAKDLYKEWFVRFRFPGHENTKFENGLPQGWEIKKIKELVKRLPFGKLYKEPDLEKEGSIVVIDQSQKELLGFHNNEPSHKATADNPIILFGDHSCKMQLMITDFSLAENVVPFVSKNNIPITFLYYTANSLIETTEYKRHWTEFMSKKVLLPKPELQEKYENLINKDMLSITNMQIQNRNLKKQRDLLLPRLMSGKLEV